MKDRRITEQKLCGMDSRGLTTGVHDAFVPACNLHDGEYDWMLEDVKTFETSETPDLAFWNDMQDIIDASPWWKKLYLKPRQIIYYRIVRFYGKYAWRKT